MVNHYQLVWTKRSQLHLKAAYEHIYEDSPQNAIKVVVGIAKAMNKAISNPEFYGPDKYKINNDGSYRAFKTYKYRIAYRYSENIIRVLRIRHTKREPKKF